MDFEINSKLISFLNWEMFLLSVKWAHKNTIIYLLFLNFTCCWNYFKLEIIIFLQNGNIWKEFESISMDKLSLIGEESHK